MPAPVAADSLAIWNRSREKFSLPTASLLASRGVPCPVAAGLWQPVLLLPGGFLEWGESLEQCARREAREETGLDVELVRQLHAYSEPGRDPRGWTVSVVYLARVKPEELKAVAADDAAEVKWFALDKLPALAFDHAMILDRARCRIGERAE